MSLLLKLIASGQGLLEIINDPASAVLFAKFVEWFKSLTKLQQLAYASKFDSFEGYGCPNCDDADCPECPDDCKVIETKLVEAAKAA